MSKTTTIEKVAARRDRLVAVAAKDGRIAPSAANMAEWRAILDKPGGEKALASLVSVAVSAAAVGDGVGGYWFPNVPQPAGSGRVAPAVADTERQRAASVVPAPAVADDLAADGLEWRFSMVGVTGS